MGTKPFCLLTVLSLAVILIFVVNIVWLTKNRIRFMKELGQTKNITTVSNFISASKNTSQQHLDKHITTTPTNAGKTFSFALMTCSKKSTTNDQ